MKTKTKKYGCGEFSNFDAFDIIQNEGIGYAIQSYCSGKDFKDAKLGKMWDKAKKILDEIENYVDTHSNDEEE